MIEHVLGKIGIDCSRDEKNTIIIPILVEEGWGGLLCTHPLITSYRKSFNLCLGQKTLIKRTATSHSTIRCTSPPLICYSAILSHHQISPYK